MHGKIIYLLLKTKKKKMVTKEGCFGLILFICKAKIPPCSQGSNFDTLVLRAFLPLSCWFSLLLSKARDDFIF